MWAAQVQGGWLLGMRSSIFGCYRKAMFSDGDMKWQVGGFSDYYLISVLGNLREVSRVDDVKQVRNCWRQRLGRYWKNVLMNFTFWAEEGHMRFLGLLVIILLSRVESVYATSFGHRETGVVVSVHGNPAICVPEQAKSAFSVGWISVTESYKKHPPSWGASLLPDFRPLELKPGDCAVLGVVPVGYEVDTYKPSAHPLRLEVNRTYLFSLGDAYDPRKSYDAVFCVNETAEGTLGYLQYSRQTGGAEVAPPCDDRRRRGAQLD